MTDNQNTNPPNTTTKTDNPATSTPTRRTPPRIIKNTNTNKMHDPITPDAGSKSGTGTGSLPKP